MNTLATQENAVAAIRISSLKQGLQGDSPEAQKEQIERFALARNIKIKKFFIFMESASKEEQPVQEAIDYCKSPKNDVQLFIIKSIDRFTRGGSYLYDHLKMQLQNHDVHLIDIYGIIGNQDVNTLEHLGIQYNWSVYSPTKKSEILEAERAKDEMRDIMTRMIGAEIRYVRMGYRVREAPFGYVNEKVETSHGKRVILKPHPEESLWIAKMFELRCQGTLNDHEIVDSVNKMGCKTRKRYKRNPNDRTKIIGIHGGNKLHIKQFWRYVQNPIYAGINVEKWTQDNLVKGKFDGIVSVDTFNKANRGKLTLSINGDEVQLLKKSLPAWQTVKLINNPKFPYKRVVMCPECRKPLFGSASRGHLGKYYPAYHCNKRGHYFRVSSKELEESVEAFVRNLNFDQEYIDNLKEYIVTLWNSRVENKKADDSIINKKIQELKATAQAAADKIKFLSSEVAIKYLEADIVKAETEAKQLEQEKVSQKKEVLGINMENVMEHVGYFLEHLEELLIDQANPLKRAAFFGLIFDSMPTYQELTSGTPKLAPYLGLKHHFGTSLVPIGEPYGSGTVQHHNYLVLTIISRPGRTPFILSNLALVKLRHFNFTTSFSIINSLRLHTEMDFHQMWPYIRQSKTRKFYPGMCF